MYQTTLKSVNGYTAVGANGERLRFVGNWYANAGDTVWTDGNIIFGHSPLKASSTMMTLPSNSGIPILLDNLRGYFSPTGTWSNYDIAQYNWIVNNQNSFAGGYDDTIIDAAFSDKGDLYLVSGGRYAEYQHISKNDRSVVQIPNPSATIYAYLGSPVGVEYTFYFQTSKGEIVYSENEEYSFGMTFDNLQSPLIVSCNNVKISEIDLTPLVNDLKLQFANFRTKIIDENPKINEWSIDEGIITALSVGLFAINLNKSGTLSYLIFGSIQGYYNISVSWSNILFKESDVWFPCGISCIYDSNFETIQKHIYGGLQQTNLNTITKYSEIWDAVNTGIVRTPFPDGAHYYIRYPDGTLSTRFWTYEETTLSGSGGRTLREGESWYVVEYDETDLSVFYSQDVAKNAVGTKDIEISLSAASTGNDVFALQLEEGSCTLDKYGLATFYDTLNKVIATDVVVDDDYCCVEINSYALDKKDIYTGFTLQGRQLIVNYKIYTPDGKIAEKTANLNDLEVDVDADGIPLMDGYYTKDTNGALTPFYFKPILKKLSDTVYLFGSHGGKLYIKTVSGIQLVGSGLKNFSLEMLNDISKAKG